MKPLELARDLSAAWFFVWSLLGWIRRFYSRCAIWYHATAAVRRPIIFLWVVSALLGGYLELGVFLFCLACVLRGSRGGDAVVVVGCLLPGGIFLLGGLASFLDVRVLVGLFLFTPF